MEFVELNNQTRPRWDEFCEKNSDAWFWHTSSFLEYQHVYRPSLETAPRHFFLQRDNQVIAICPLALELNDTVNGAVKVFSLGGDSLPSPVITDSAQSSDRARIAKALFEHIDSLAVGEAVAKISYRSAVLTPRFLSAGTAPVNETLSFGYLDFPFHTQILDLQSTRQSLWANVRKSYHSLIRRVSEAFTFALLDRKTITQESFDAYRLLHHKAAGRVTRPLETFRLMHDWIKNGHAVLAQVLQGETVVAAALLMTYKGKAYYGSACEEPELAKEWSLGHFLQWKLIEELPTRGMTHYELGWQFPSPQMSYIPTPDEQKIAFFKRGFGGTTVPLFASRKYYSADLMRAELTAQVNKLSAALQPQVAVKG